MYNTHFPFAPLFTHTLFGSCLPVRPLPHFLLATHICLSLLFPMPHRQVLSVWDLTPRTLAALCTLSYTHMPIACCLHTRHHTHLHFSFMLFFALHLLLVHITISLLLRTRLLLNATPTCLCPRLAPYGFCHACHLFLHLYPCGSAPSFHATLLPRTITHAFCCMPHRIFGMVHAPQHRSLHCCHAFFPTWFAA